MNTDIVILITGTRAILRIEHQSLIKEKILDIINKHDKVTLVHGGCSGVDKYAEEICKGNKKVSIISVLPQWELYGKRAGPIRNQHMIDTYMPHYVLAFPSVESRGTYDCIDRANKYKKEPGTRLKEIHIHILS